MSKQPMVEKYNEMLRDEYGQNITVQLRSCTEDDGNVLYYYTSARYGDINSFETIEEAYSDACLYLSYVGELW